MLVEQDTSTAAAADDAQAMATIRHLTAELQRTRDESARVHAAQQRLTEQRAAFDKVRGAVYDGLILVLQHMHHSIALQHPVEGLESMHKGPTLRVQAILGLPPTQAAFDCGKHTRRDWMTCSQLAIQDNLSLTGQ